MEENLWVVVRVERGLPTEVMAFRREELAIEQEELWRATINVEYDETEVFGVVVSDAVHEDSE